MRWPGQAPLTSRSLQSMKRIVAIVAFLAVVGVSCSSGLSDAERVWCLSNILTVADAGLHLQTAELIETSENISVPAVVDLFPGLSGVRSVSETGRTTTFRNVDAYQRTCKAAYESRDTAAPTSSAPPATTTTRPVPTTIPLKAKLLALPVGRWTETDLNKLSQSDREDLYLTITRPMLPTLGIRWRSDEQLLSSANVVCSWLGDYEGNLAAIAFIFGDSLKDETPEGFEAELAYFSTVSVAVSAICPEWHDEIEHSLATWIPPSG